MIRMMLAAGSDVSFVEEQFELARWSSGNALLVGLALTAVLLWAVAWMYRHEGRGPVSRRMRFAMTLCRAAAIALLGLIGLEPVMARYVYRQTPASTLVLIDDSASMGIADRYRDGDTAARIAGFVGESPEAPAERTRCALVERLVTPAWLDALRRRNAVRVFRFSDALDEVPIDALTTRPAAGAVPAAAPSSPPDLGLSVKGTVTDVSLAVRRAVEAVGAAPIAAIVLISDGNLNAGEPADAIARYLRSREIPLHAVGVGDPAPPVNVRIVDLTAPRMIFKDDPFQITVHLAAEGLDGRAIDLELRERRPGAADAPASADLGRIVERRSVRPNRTGRFDPVIFERRVADAGDIAYVARAVPLEDEAVESDNVRETMPAIRVLDDRMRVLLVGGAPSFDYRFLARLLVRDKTIDVSCWLQSAEDRAVREGTTIIDHLPDTPEELFQYDALLLIDPDPTELTHRWSQRVAALVGEHGGGLLYAAGKKFTGDFLRNPKTGPLVELLPVVLDPNAELLLNDLGIYQQSAWPLLIPDDAIANPILRMSDDPVRNRQIWSSLDGVFWHYPVRREKTAATVLMRHANPRMVNADGPHVLLATQFVGSGRTAFLAFDNTWRWRRWGDTYFNRFWIQTLRFLVEGKLLGARNRGTILTDRDRYSLGDTVLITARLLDEQYQPLAVPRIDLTIAPAGDPSRTLVLEPLVDRAGYYQGRFVADRPGTLRLSLSLPGPPGRAPAVQREIVVTQPDLEMANPVMRRAVLNDLAEATGGRYFDIDEAAALPDLIDDRSRTLVLRERPRPLWDNQYVLAALIGLLTLEWILRRVSKLL